MIRKNLMKSLSVIMATMLAVMTVACGSNTAAVESAVQTEVSAEAAQEEELQNTITKASNVVSGESEAGKVETVYVTADANGAVNDVIVSEWLKNAESTKELSDKTELQNIVNVKGSETYKEGSDGSLTWDAEGADIYYQGTTDKKLPVTMKITYTLDGKEISPEELAGKSGRVTMRFEYENNDKQVVNVNGKDLEVYTPFAMVSGMMLDAEKFTNVEISNGKVISDGGNYIVMGVAVPGLKESLDISEDKWDKLEDADEIKDKLSGSFEITADTSDFELGMTITMASSDILSDFGISDLSDSDKINDIKDDMEELSDGAGQLVDGVHELKDGTGKFVDGTNELYNGTSELKDGTQKLFDGTGTLADGTGALLSGTESLADGIYKYTDGTAKLGSGAKALYDGTGALKAGTESLKNGMKNNKMVESSQALAQGAGQVSTGVGKLGEKVMGIGTAMAGLTELETMYRQVSLAEAYLTGAPVAWSDDVAAGIETISGGEISKDDPYNQYKVNKLIEAVNGSENGAAKIKGALKGINDLVVSFDGAAVTTQVKDDENYEENVIEAVTGTLTNDAAGSDEEDKKGSEGSEETAPADAAPADAAPAVASEAPAEGSTSDDKEKAAVSEAGAGSQEEKTDDETKKEQTENGEEAVEVVEVVKQTPADTIPEGSVVISRAQYETLKSYVAALATGESIDSLVYAVGSYNKMIGAAEATKQAIEKVQAATAGMSFDEKSIAELNALIDGAKSVAAGSAALSQGIEGVYAGAVKLDEGAGDVQKGAKALSDGAKTLTDNNSQLRDGASKLNDGAQQLNSGASDLRDGAGQLNDGTGKLLDGTKELRDGAVTLDDGVAELVDGMVRFDEEGIQKIYEAFDGDLTEFADRLSAIQKAGGNYKTFGGSSEDVDGSVKFIIKTDSVKSL